MKNLFNSKDREDLLFRISKIKEDTIPKWGKMNAHQTIVHLTDPMRAALGERPVAFEKSLFGVWPLNKLISQLLPWPKGAPTNPNFIQGMKGTKPYEFEKDLESLREIINRFSAQDKSVEFKMNPMFGKLSNDEWARTMWRHIDHHLRQFGI